MRRTSFSARRHWKVCLPLLGAHSPSAPRALLDPEPADSGPNRVSGPDAIPRARAVHGPGLGGSEVRKDHRLRHAGRVAAVFPQISVEGVRRPSPIPAYHRRILKSVVSASPDARPLCMRWLPSAKPSARPRALSAPLWGCETVGETPLSALRSAGGTSGIALRWPSPDRWPPQWRGGCG